MKIIKHANLSISNLIRIGISILGGALIAAALLGEVFISSLSRGIGPLQILIIGVGLGIIILAWMNFSILGRVIIVIISTIVIIVLLEGVLTLMGYKTEYKEPSGDYMNADIDLQINPIRVCDADTYGCRWNVDLTKELCAEPNNKYFLCPVNSYGLTSKYEFTRESLPEDAYRILVLGDSFTWGAAADKGHGWVDITERILEEHGKVIVWNAAMPGTGTRQAILTAQNLIPIMQPNLVILGFHTGNDFNDNQYPADRFIDVLLEDGTSTTVQQYSQWNGKTFRETDKILYYRAHGYTVSSLTGIDVTLYNLIRSTRTGTLLVGFYRFLTSSGYYINTTQPLLEELQSLALDSGSQFMVVIIPEQQDTIAQTQKYSTAMTLFRNSTIPYVDTLSLLEFADFENENEWNKHWNNDAHRKAGEFIGNCLIPMLDDTTNLEALECIEN